ncbi:MAG: hypothetical protein LBJ69_01235 [Holosporales bacterium]|nr:hypothetical protein [Holosporales bacterium]
MIRQVIQSVLMLATGTDLADAAGGEPSADRYEDPYLHWGDALFDRGTSNPPPGTDLRWMDGLLGDGADTPVLNLDDYTSEHLSPPQIPATPHGAQRGTFYEYLCSLNQERPTKLALEKINARLAAITSRYTGPNSTAQPGRQERRNYAAMVEHINQYSAAYFQAVNDPATLRKVMRTLQRYREAPIGQYDNSMLRMLGCIPQSYVLNKLAEYAMRINPTIRLMSNTALTRTASRSTWIRKNWPLIAAVFSNPDHLREAMSFAGL